MEKIILEMKSITKTFPGVKALDDVNFKVVDGEIHALIGENGAGKSTLMNVLSGTYPYGTYSGDIFIDKKVCKFSNIKDSEKFGVVIIHQELALIPELSIAENIFLGNERAKKGFIDWNETDIKANEMLKRVGLTENIHTKIKNIGVGKQQMVEIVKALAKDVRILILDEPTAALNQEDSQKLLELLVQLKKEGITSILISHKLNELLQVADKITILRDGATIETIKNNSEISEDYIIKGMVGRELTNRYPIREKKIGEKVFEVKNWNVDDPIVDNKKLIKNVNLYVKKGEIVGLAGLMGAGRTEFAKSLFGKAYGKNITGEIYKDGKLLKINNIKNAIEAGLAYVTEDRKKEGLNLIDTIKNNIPIAKLSKISKRNFVDANKEIKEAEEYRKKFNIKTPNILECAGNLSGGNQQKVVLSKWIFTEPDILILDEPTRGIDVGAKYEIYKIINYLVEMGKSVIVISSELPEILGICDRVYVMSEGSFVGELPIEEASQEAIMKCIMDSNKEGI